MTEIPQENSRTIDDYIDAVKVRHDFKSDREVGRFLEFKGAPVTFWRNRKAWPTPDNMVKLADAGGMDPDLALADLGQWSSQGPAIEVYRRIAEKLAKVAAILAGIIIASSAEPAAAAVVGTGLNYIGQSWNIVTAEVAILYIM